jgi:aminodeoxyfutalosine deaminase
MIAHVAKWVLPVSQPPIEDGAVVVSQRRIQQVGPASEVLQGFKGLICEHGVGAIVPGLVNCHVHLEFSALAGRIPPQEDWEAWLTATLAEAATLTATEIAAAIPGAIEALWACGTALAGEVTNTGESWLHLQHGPLDYQLFYECLGFDRLQELELAGAFPFFQAAGVAEDLRISAAAHAPYSVSGPLFKAVAAWNAPRRRPQMVHLAESQAELEFLARGNGFFERLLKGRGRWVPGFMPPQLSPAAYLDSLGFLGPQTLAVHGTWLTPAEIDLLAARGAWLVLCPRANRYTGSGMPPVVDLLNAGVPLALGTDSLAGNWDLNLFGEMLWLQQNFPACPAETWLQMGTLNGARALGREASLGSLEPGKRSALGLVPLDNGVDLWNELFAAGAAGRFRWLG